MKRRTAQPAEPLHPRMALQGRPAAWAAGLLLVVATVLAYLPAMRCGYIWDDDYYVQNNPTLRSAGGLVDIWFDVNATPQYYPMVHTTYWLEYRLWKLHPLGYHIDNILLHALGAVVLWRVLILLSIPGAWAAAAIFALHPVQVESVAWITERKNVLSGFFYFASAWAYLRHAGVGSESPEPGHRRILYAAALAMFLLALFSKTVACTLPAALLLVLWWKGRPLKRRILLGLAPFFILGATLGMLTARIERSFLDAGSEWSLTFLDRCLVAGRAIWFYVGKLLWPGQLVFIYPRWQIDATEAWQYAYPLAAISTPLALWLCRKRIGRGPLVGALCFVGTLFPALGFLDVYPMRYSFVADHWQYLAGAAFIALAVATIHRLLELVGRHRPLIGSLGLVVLLGILANRSWGQEQSYQDLETLWQDTLLKNPSAWMAHNNLAKVYQSQGRLPEAVEHYRRVLELKPDYPRAHSNLGGALAGLGKFEEAAKELRRVLASNPDFAAAHYNLANVLLSQRKIAGAIDHYRRALAIQPDLVEAHLNLGSALLASGQVDEAITHYREAAANRPKDPGVHYQLGATLASIGRPAEALEPLRQAARLKPDWLTPVNDLAWILATRIPPSATTSKEAIALAERAAAATQQENAEILDTLAAAYASAGQFEWAISTARKAIDLADDQAAAPIRRRLELYRQRKAYHEEIRSGDRKDP